MDVVTGRTKPLLKEEFFKENINLFKYDESSIVDLGIAIVNFSVHLYFLIIQFFKI